MSDALRFGKMVSYGTMLLLTWSFMPMMLPPAYSRTQGACAGGTGVPQPKEPVPMEPGGVPPGGIDPECRAALEKLPLQRH